MAEYIDKDALVAEIQKRAIEAGLHDGVIAETREDECYSILSLINTLEVKEVDLAKEYDNEFFKDPVFGKLVNRNAGIGIAKHFFELGLAVSNKAQKGEEV